MPAPVAPAPRNGSGRAVKPGPGSLASPRAGAGGGSPSAAMQAGPRRSRLQFLLDIAQATFSQPTPPTAQQIDALRRCLSLVPLDELGLGGHADGGLPPTPDVDSSSSSRSSSPSLTDGTHPLLGSLLEEEERAASVGAADDARRPRPPITYLLIYEDERVSLGIFCLPARARIPLHNHPGMTVMSRVLHGRMHVSSYDWLHPTPADAVESVAEQEQRLPREARVVLDRTLVSSDQPAVLFPRAGGNIHQFTAVTDCAVLDLMSPPYATEEGRDCTYYAVAPRSQLGGPVVLDAYEPPADFVINQGEYQGLQIRPKATPLFAGTSLFPSSHADSSRGDGAAGGAAAAGQAAAPGSPPPSGGPSQPSPSSSPTSDATGAPKLSSLGGRDGSRGQGGGSMSLEDCAASRPEGLREGGR